eukprot:364955_1
MYLAIMGEISIFWALSVISITSLFFLFFLFLFLFLFKNSNSPSLSSLESLPSSIKSFDFNPCKIIVPEQFFILLINSFTFASFTFKDFHSSLSFYFYFYFYLKIQIH